MILCYLKVGQHCGCITKWKTINTSQFLIEGISKKKWKQTSQQKTENTKNNNVTASLWIKVRPAISLYTEPVELLHRSRVRLVAVNAQKAKNPLKRTKENLQPLNIRSKQTCNSSSDVFFAFVPIFLVINSSRSLAKADHHHAGEVLVHKHTRSITVNF